MPAKARNSWMAPSSRSTEKAWVCVGGLLGRAPKPTSWIRQSGDGYAQLRQQLIEAAVGCKEKGPGEWRRGLPSGGSPGPPFSTRDEKTFTAKVAP